jgi:DNA-binding transcriptional regulator LsrR (DeoR family)
MGNRRRGQRFEGGTNERVTSVSLPVPPKGLVVGVAAGHSKVVAIRAALKDRHLNGFITTETTAQALVD